MTDGRTPSGSLPGTSPALLEAALALAHYMGARALDRFRGALEVETKADGSPVTVADRDTELAGRGWLDERFPDDGVLGEEWGATRPEAPRRWLLDPIDGTQSFIRGVPLWASLVAVCQGDQVLAGAAHFPALDEWIAAAPGAGCWWNGRAARVSNVSELARATVLITDAAPRRDVGDSHAAAAAGWLRLSRSAGRARTWGDAYGYLLVATGRAEAMLDPEMHPWDAAPLGPIVTEAGGVFTDWHGAPTAFGPSTVATNAALAQAVRAQLTER